VHQEFGDVLCFRLPGIIGNPAMPVTTVQKMRIVIIMVIRRMKASPRGFMATARAGTEIAKRHS